MFLGDLTLTQQVATNISCDQYQRLRASAEAYVALVTDLWPAAQSAWIPELTADAEMGLRAERPRRFLL
jgi:hypothetical protein